MSTTVKIAAQRVLRARYVEEVVPAEVVAADLLAAVAGLVGPSAPYDFVGGA